MAVTRSLCLAVVVAVFCVISDRRGGVQAAREADRVDFLPGLDPQPTFNHYAGYLDATDGKQLFYWFVESERDPATDPLVVWYNGGPGCSSLTGFLVELGPWRVKPDGSGLIWFEERWNKIANMIFIESPAGVGYSYDENCDYETNDNMTAYYNHMALKDFYAGFPEYANHDFYITGESYAGVYVPTLAARIVDDPEFQFKGMAVGNGLTNYELMQNGLMYFAWARGVFGTALGNRLLDECCVDRNASNCDFYLDSTEISPACRAALWEANIMVWANGLNPYNLYQQCDGGVSPDFREDLVFIPEETPYLGQEQYEIMMTNLRSKVARVQNTNCTQVASDVVCTDATSRDIYLNNPEVREALHVGPEIHQWTFCSAMLSSVYTRQYKRMDDEYHKVLNAGHRVLIFYGDLDMACEHLSGMWYVERLGLGEPIQPYQPWYYTATELDNTTQIAGYSIMYDRLNYVTVKGAGHFVPTDKPVPSFDMWERFLNDEPF